MDKNFKLYANSAGISSTTLHDVEKSTMGSNLIECQTPMIIEEREMRVTQLSVFDRLMMERIIWIANPINTAIASVVQAQLMFLDDIDDKDITLHLDTPGGSVISGLGIRDVMNYIKSDVATVNVGHAASMGAVLLSSGAKGKRRSLNYSQTMIHQASHGTQGNVQDTRVNQREAEKYNYLLFKILSENCGRSLDDMMAYAERDFWLNSAEAKKLGIIDEIYGLGKDKPINEMLEGFDDYMKAKNSSPIIKPITNRRKK